jgi:O-antigen/teichoic acid export membrane protein
MLQKIIETFGTKIVSSVLSFLIVILTTQYLGAEGRGIVAIITTTVGIILLINNFVGGPALVYLVPRRNPLFLILISYIWAFFVFLISLMVLYLINWNLKHWNFHICLLSLIWSFVSIHMMVMVGRENLRIYNLILLLQVAVNFIALFIFFVFLKKQTVSYFVFSFFLSYIIPLIVSYFFVRDFFKGFFLQKFENIGDILKEVTGLGFMSQLGNVIQFLNYRLSYYLLNHYCDHSTVGIYSVGVALAEAVWMIGNSIGVVQYSRIANSSDINYSRGISIQLSKLSLVLTSIATLILLLLPTRIFALVFGKDFLYVKGILFILSPGIIALGFCMAISHYFAGIGKYYVNTSGASLGLVFTILFNLLLIPGYKAKGAAVSATLSYLATTIFLTVWFIKETKVSLFRFIPGKKDINLLIEELKLKKA